MKTFLLLLCASFVAAAQCSTVGCTPSYPPNCSGFGSATYTQSQDVSCSTNCNGYYSAWVSNASAELNCCLGNAQCEHQNGTAEACQGWGSANDECWINYYDFVLIGDYFRHWIAMQHALRETPRIFHVNWFRKDERGQFLWPGFSENLRILRWIVERAHGRAAANETPIGWMPGYDDIDWTGLDYPREKFEELQRCDPEDWHREVLEHENWLMRLQDHLPPEIVYQRELLICRLQEPNGSNEPPLANE